MDIPSLQAHSILPLPLIKPQVREESRERTLPRQNLTPNRDGRQLHTPQNSRGRGNKSMPKGRNGAPQGPRQSSDAMDCGQMYNVNTQNRYDVLQTDRGNEHNARSPVPARFLGRGTRGHPRGHGQGNRPRRDRSRQTHYPNYPQQWWHPPEWEEHYSPARVMRTNQGGDAGQAGESSRKRRREHE